jgi:hypothetical protein
VSTDQRKKGYIWVMGMGIANHGAHHSPIMPTKYLGHKKPPPMCDWRWWNHYMMAMLFLLTQ